MVNQNTPNDTIVLGGGCFWCTEAIYKNIHGVIDVKPGYSGGDEPNPTYKDVCTGETGHAEVVQIIFNRNIVDLKTILKIFFESHDPTTLNRQGADIGTQYRSIIFYTNQEQKEIALKTIKDLQNQNIFKDHIVTKVEPFKTFYIAENYHMDYYSRNKNQPYCRFVIQPKVEKIKTKFADQMIK